MKLVLFLFMLVTSVAFAEGETQSPQTTAQVSTGEVDRLYLSIIDKEEVLDQMGHRRFQRMLLKEIITLGQFELQIINQKEFKEIDFTGTLLKVDLKAGGVSDQVEIDVTVARYQDGKKKNFKGEVVRVSKIGLFSSGIEQVYKILTENAQSK